MKTAIVLFFCVALAYAEQCMEDSECVHETCDASTTLSCLRGECTCATDEELEGGAFGGFGGGAGGFGGGEFPSFAPGAGGFGDFEGGAFPSFAAGEFPTFAAGEFPSFAPGAGGFGDFDLSGSGGALPSFAPVGKK